MDRIGFVSGKDINGFKDMFITTRYCITNFMLIHFQFVQVNFCQFCQVSSYIFVSSFEYVSSIRLHDIKY